MRLASRSFIAVAPRAEATTDRSELGLYLHDEPSAHKLSSAVLVNDPIRIPPHAKERSDTAERTFKRDVPVCDLLPLANYRGKMFEFRAFCLDGREEVLLSVPNYDFNWQTTYMFQQPKVLPVGTRVAHRTWWGNSAQNPANPDPMAKVPWGLRSWHEMLFGAYLDDGPSTHEVADATANEHRLADAPTVVLAGERLAVERVRAPGCLINFHEPDGEQEIRSAHREHGWKQGIHHGSH